MLKRGERGTYVTLRDGRGQTLWLGSSGGVIGYNPLDGLLKSFDL